MSIENVSSENANLASSAIMPFSLKEAQASQWNGRFVNNTTPSVLMDRMDRIKHIIFLNRPVYPSRTQSTAFCGSRVSGEASININADSKGNTSAGVEVGVKSEDGSTSGSVHGGVSRDKDGNTTAEIEGRVDVKF